MTVYSIDGQAPAIDAQAWVADTARVVGHVELGPESSVWFSAVIRGDQAEPVRIGARTNVQDGAVLHSDPGRPLTVGSDVSVGHLAMLHGCTVGDGSLIGIGAIVLNGAVIGKGCLVGAGALVTEDKIFPDHSLIVGSPARAVRTLSQEQVAGLLRNALTYVERSRRYRDGLQISAPVQPASPK